MRQPVLFVLFLCFICTGVGYAQISFGIRGGLNISDVVINNVIDPDAESDFDLKAGLHGGIFAIAEVGTRAGLTAELLYSSKGVRAITNINLHYICLPLLVRYKLGEKFTAEGGAEIGYLIAARSRYGRNNNYDNKLDIGLDAGLQYYFFPDISIGLRFNAGLSSVIRNLPPSGPGEKIRYQNRVLQIGLSYRFYKTKA